MKVGKERKKKEMQHSEPQYVVSDHNGVIGMYDYKEALELCIELYSFGASMRLYDPPNLVIKVEAEKAENVDAVIEVNNKN